MIKRNTKRQLIDNCLLISQMNLYSIYSLSWAPTSFGHYVQQLSLHQCGILPGPTMKTCDMCVLKSGTWTVMNCSILTCSFLAPGPKCTKPCFRNRFKRRFRHCFPHSVHQLSCGRSLLHQAEVCIFILSEAALNPPQPEYSPIACYRLIANETKIDRWYKGIQRALKVIMQGQACQQYVITSACMMHPAHKYKCILWPGWYRITLTTSHICGPVLQPPGWGGVGRGGVKWGYGA